MLKEDWLTIISTLETKGWFWREGFLYAPHETMWLSDPWPLDLVDMRERMERRLLRIQKNKRWFSEDQFVRVESDTASLVEVLTRLTE